jgi:hypothetical protein
MSIHFTQYLMPDGRKQDVYIEMPEEIEKLASKFIEADGWYEAEMLSDMVTISLTACWNQKDSNNDVVIQLAPNGPAVVKAVEELVRESVMFLETVNQSE